MLIEKEVAVDDFAAWASPHVPAMTRLAARLAPGCGADDVVQEALIRAWDRRRSYDPDRGTPAAWLLALTADKAARARRTRGRRPTAELIDAAVPAADDDRTDVERALRRLTDRQRLAVDCFYYAGLSVAETAAVRDCSVGTVKSTLSDARARLKGLLEVTG